MSFEPGDIEIERDIHNQLAEITTLLRAILTGIEIIADQDEGELLTDIEED